jgi:HK97 family phage major capsid protein
MTRKEYEAQRKVLIDSAQELLNKGDLGGSKEKQAEVMALDDAFELIGKEQANLNALTNNIQAVQAPLINMSGISDMVIDKIERPLIEAPIFEDKYASIEYRRAYMENVLRGTPIPAKFNIDTFTTITEAAALIPTTILEEIIREIKTYGQLYSRVRKLNVKGGVNVPILSLIPTATWITEAAPSSRQNVEMNTSVSFLYYGLECKIATSLLANETTLPSFEGAMVTLIAEAMLKAIDTSIIKGVGTSSPLGVTLDPRVVAGQKITITSGDFGSWDAL